MDERRSAITPVSIYYCYASEDERYCLGLEKHLSGMRRLGMISDWHQRKIIAGENRQQVIDSHLESAAIILLLISPAFIASDYCYDVEMERALQREAAGNARVIPVLLRPVDWQDAPFAHLQYLPRNGKPVTRWSNRDEAFLDIARGIREVVADIYGPAGTHLPPLPGPVRGAREQAALESQNRQRFLKRVRMQWISGVLEHSLYNATMLALGLHELPDAVANPWRLLVQETQQPARPLPAGTHITQVYDDADGELLILGEPGAGKTTLLLALARDLLERAQRDADHPLPAVFHLSSWAEKRQPLAAWLIEELHEKYAVPSHLASAWLETSRLLPLLDGLDEVAQEHRAACIDAINQYHHEHSLDSIVVCSRHAEYMALPVRISLQQSVMVQSLTDEQIDEYLFGAGEQLAALRDLLHRDSDLREMAKTPLMLNIMMLTYQGEPLGELASVQSYEQRRHQIFTRYVERMFERRGIGKRYSLQQTRHWLAALAVQMKLHGQAEFYIERIRMDWLGDLRAQRLYRIGTVFICAFFGIMVGILVGILSFGLLATPITGLGIGLATILLSGSHLEMKPAEAFIWSWKGIRRQWFILLVFVFTGGLAGVLGASPGKEYVAALVGILFGILVGLLLSVLVSGEPHDMPSTRNIISPNQEVLRSARYSLSIMFVSAVFCILFVLVNKLYIFFAGIFGLCAVLGFGGLACIQHFVLRYLLWRSGMLPWNLPRFLDCAVERVLLRRVGGGYIFIHRLLLDYFASLEAHLS